MYRIKINLLFCFLIIASSSIASAQRLVDSTWHVKAPMQRFVVGHFDRVFQGNTQATTQDFSTRMPSIFNDTMMVFKGQKYLRASNIKAVRQAAYRGQNLVIVELKGTVGKRLPYDQLNNRQMAAWLKKQGLFPSRSVVLKVQGNKPGAYKIVR